MFASVLRHSDIYKDTIAANTKLNVDRVESIQESQFEQARFQAAGVKSLS